MLLQASFDGAKTIAQEQLIAEANMAGLGLNLENQHFPVTGEIGGELRLLNERCAQQGDFGAGDSGIGASHRGVSCYGFMGIGWSQL